MKLIFKYKFAWLLSIFLLGGTACSDELVELNVDPNNPVEVPASNLVTQGQYQFHNLMMSRGLNAEWSMLMVQHWAQNEYAEDSRYTVDGNDFDFVWINYYASVLNELDAAKQIINETETILPGVRANQLAVIEIMMVNTFHALLDNFGDVPYSQALNSVDFPLPAYDAQENIYPDLLARMEAAVNSMVEGAESFGGADLIYGGNVSQWKKLGNSLMLRMAMRISDVAESTASTYVNSAIDGGVFESNADNALFVFSEDPNLANPLYIDATLNNRDDFAVSEVLVNSLKDMGDPRLDIFADTTNSGDIVGMPYGLTDGEAFDLKSTTSRPSELVRTNTFPYVLMDYAEVAFLKAEAVERGFTSGDAAAMYAEGVTASMNYWGIEDQAAIDDYIAANPYNDSNWKESLGWQKWIAFYMNGPQAWAEWRRLDYPELEVPAAATNPVIPVRLPYPISEQTRNNSSLQKVTSNPNDLSTPLWWDVN